MGMKHKGFAYEVKAELLLTVAEVAILMALSERHYDGRCKGVGKVGGFLYGMANRVEWATEDGCDEIPALRAWSEVDTLCKILESSRTDEECTLAWEMKTLLLAMRDEQRRMNDLP